MKEEVPHAFLIKGKQPPLNPLLELRLSAFGPKKLLGNFYGKTIDKRANAVSNQGIGKFFMSGN